jgi:hypothetical protein
MSFLTFTLFKGIFTALIGNKLYKQSPKNIHNPCFQLQIDMILYLDYTIIEFSCEVINWPAI